RRHTRLQGDWSSDVCSSDLRYRPERPVGLFQEYWRNPAATEASRRGDWYVTGDRAYVDADGYFWFVGRSDDVIISAGYRIGPFRSEERRVGKEGRFGRWRGA